MRFPPASFEVALTFPFQWFAGLHPTSEGSFRIAVFAFLAVLIPMVFLVALARRRGRGSPLSPSAPGRRVTRPEAEPDVITPRASLWLVIVFSAISYAIWLRLFAIQRYLMPVSFLSGLLLWLACDYLLAEKRAKLVVFFFFALFSVLWMQRESDSWRVPYGSSWFGLELPAEVEQPGTLFVMLGGGAMGYVVPYLPESSRTIRLMDFTLPPDGAPTEMARRAQQILEEQTGPMRSLSVEPLAPGDWAYLRRFGLQLAESECKTFHSDAGPVTSCPIVRHSAG